MAEDSMTALVNILQSFVNKY